MSKVLPAKTSNQGELWPWTSDKFHSEYWISFRKQKTKSKKHFPLFYRNASSTLCKTEDQVMRTTEYFELKPVIDRLQEFGWRPGDDEELLDLVIAKIKRQADSEEDNALIRMAEKNSSELAGLTYKEAEAARILLEAAEQTIETRRAS